MEPSLLELEYDSSVSPYLEPLPVLEGLTVVPKVRLKR